MKKRSGRRLDRRSECGLPVEGPPQAVTIEGIAGWWDSGANSCLRCSLRTTTLLCSCPVPLGALTRSRLLVGLAVETEPGSIGNVVFGSGLSPRTAPLQDGSGLGGHPG